MREINVAMIGEGFMGRTHSNAWVAGHQVLQAPGPPGHAYVVRTREEHPKIFSNHWGWTHASTNWEAAVKPPEIDLVDIVTPNFMHAPVAMAAIAAGKNVSCEKPIAGTLAEARTMVKAASEAGSRRSSGTTTAAARPWPWRTAGQGGQLGTIRHVRAFYLQDWADESVPSVWRFKKKAPGRAPTATSMPTSLT